jgi:membrane-associated phospholipid phosphatase
MQMDNETIKVWKIFSSLLLSLIIIVILLPRDDSFLWLNQSLTPLGDHFWGFVTNLGDGYIAALIPIFYLLKQLDMFRATLWATVVALPFVQIMKFTSTVIRPGFIVEGSHIFGGLPSSWSFPSGHTATAGVVFGVIALMTKSKIIRYVSLLLILLVGLSRVAVGVHWPLDISVGALVGFLSATAGVLLTKERSYVKLSDTILVAILTAASFNFIRGAHLDPALPRFQIVYGSVATLLGIIATIYLLQGWLKWKKSEKI